MTLPTSLAFPQALKECIDVVDGIARRSRYVSVHRKGIGLEGTGESLAAETYNLNKSSHD